MPTTIKEDIEIKEKDFEKNKNKFSKEINKLKINHQAFSPITSKLSQITSFLDIQNYNHIIDSKISSLLNELKTKAYNIYQNANNNITKELKSINDKGKTRHSNDDIRNRAKNRLKELENDKRILEESKTDLDKYFKHIDTLRNYCNTSSSELEKLNNQQSRREVGGAAMFAIGSSVFGAETAALMGTAYKGIRTIASSKGRENIKNIIKEKGWGGIAKSGAAKLTLATGAYLGSPGIVAVGGLANASINKQAELKKRNSNVLSKLNSITADKGIEGVAHGPTAMMMAADGKPESFKVTPGKTSVNGVEIGQGQSKDIIEELKKTNNLLDQNNEILKSILGVNKDSLEWQQDEDKEDELKRKEAKKAEFKGFDPKSEKKKEEEAKKGFFENLKSSVIGFARSLLPKSGVGWAKLGGGLVGAGIGAWGGSKLGTGLAHMMGAEEGSTGEAVGKYGGMAAGAIGGAWGGSKLAGKVAGSKFFKKTGLGKLLGGAGGIVSDQIARAEADQKVYVTNASEIGRACKDGGGIMDLLGGKKGKIPSKIFKGGIKKSATRLAAKVGGRGLAKTVAGGIGTAAKFSKFAGPVGLAITAGMAAMDASKGWANAGEIAGLKPGQKASTGQKFGAAASSVLSGLSFGLVDAKSIYGAGKSVKNALFGGKDKITGEEKKGFLNSTAGKIMMSATGPVGLLADVLINKKSSMLGTIGKNISDLFNKQNKHEDKLLKDKEDQQKGFFDSIKEKGLLGTIGDKIQQTVQEGKETFKAAKESGKGNIAAGWEAVKKMTGLGKVAAYFESGGKSGAGVISSGKGDHGGKSYGSFQLASKTGTLQHFLNTSGYGKQFAGMKVGSAEFDAKWKALAKTDPNFAKAQQAFAVQTHYNPQMNKLAKSGLDLSKRGSGVQETIMSTANQYGAGTDLIVKALKGKDVSKMSDSDIINTIQDYKAKTVNTRFKSSSASVRAGVAKRIEQERKMLLAVNSEKAGGGAEVAKDKPGKAKAKPKLDEYGEPIIFGDAQERRQNKQRAELKAKKKREQEAKPVAKPEAKPAGKAKGYTDDSLTITQGPVTPGKHGIIASRTEKMPDGTEKIYPIYGNPALGPTGKQVENQIAKDRAAILAKMKKGTKKQGDNGSEKVVAESKETYSNSEGVKLKKAERSKVAAKDKTPTVINNVTNNNSTSGQAPKIFVSTNDTNSFPGRLARSY